MEIKSKKAEEILDNAWTSISGTVFKEDAKEAIIIAEQEAEERNEKEMQDKAKDAFCYSMNIGFSCKKRCGEDKCVGYDNFTEKLKEK